MLSSAKPGEEATPDEQDVQPLTKRQSILNNLRQLWDSLLITLFVIGTALVVFAAARNTLTWHLQKFWGTSADYWQSLWEKMYDFFGADEMTVVVLGTPIVSNGVFWLFNLLLIFVDYTGRPQALLKYKIQEDKNVPVDPARLKTAVLTVLFNQTVIGLPFGYVMYYLMKLRGCEFGRQGLPTFHWALFELAMFILVEEIMFYYSHRILHHPFLYKRLHKKHHEWTAPIGIIALYAHPVEHAVSNMLPGALGPLLMGSHIATACLWFSLALITTSISHSGYHFPLLPSPEAHDYHHLKFTNNFGVLGILDRLHNTDNMFRASTQYQRHFMLLSLTPMIQQFPENTKNQKSK